MKNLNILITGYYYVGTSSIIERLIHNSFTIDIINTIGIEFRNKKDENINYRYWIVPDKYYVFTEKYNCDYYILVFDITDRYSFEKIEEYYKYFINLLSLSTKILFGVLETSLYSNAIMIISSPALIK